MKIFCVISHTHWDREWYQPLEVFRLRLVDLIDRCLQLMEQNPEYIFHLDAQTVVIEDYLTIRSSNKEKLKKLICQGRLIVGPWYLQNDFYLTSGEATVRNLLEGHRIANEYGQCQKVGCALDQFGNISQLPQILADFDIHNFIFGRGYSFYNTSEDNKYYRKLLPAEFRWCGADGTEALAINLPYWYSNAQRFPKDIQKSIDLLKHNEKLFEGISVTPYILLMNGVDHLEAQDDLLPILKEVNEELDDEHKVYQYKLQDYMSQVQQYIDDHHVLLTTQKGELRSGRDGDILRGTLSSRPYLKILNVKAQNCLESQLEPLYSMLELSGMKGAYSIDHFRFMWKELMKNHPHDSICGCSVDKVHKHMEDRYCSLFDTFEELTNRAMDLAAQKINVANYSNENYIVLVANTTEVEQNRVVSVVIEIPKSESFEGIEIVDGNSKLINYELLLRRDAVKDVASPLNLPGMINVDRYEVQFYVENIQPFSFKGYIVRRPKLPYFRKLDKSTELYFMENEFLKVDVDPQSGQIDLLDKSTNRWIRNVFEIEDVADEGDSYRFGDAKDQPIYASSFPAEIKVIEQSALRQVIEIYRLMELPKFYDFHLKQRSQELIRSPITLRLALEKGDKFLTVDYKVDNTAHDHRMRLLLHTSIKTDTIICDIPFDIIAHNDYSQSYGSKVVPNTSFASLENDNQGVAVLTEGQHETEHLQDRKAIAITIVRSTGVINRAPDLSEGAGEKWRVPENQCMRIVEGKLGVCPYSSQYAEKIPVLAKIFRNKPITYFTSCDPRKFKVGRATVQDTSLENYYYLPDLYPKIKIKDNTSLFSICGKRIMVTALKKAENEDGIVARFVNLDEQDQAACVQVNGVIFNINMSEKSRSYIAEDQFECKLTSKKIKTILIQ